MTTKKQTKKRKDPYGEYNIVKEHSHSGQWFIRVNGQIVFIGNLETVNLWIEKRREALIHIYEKNKTRVKNA